mgnify:CR=1 FL=1
MSKAMDIAEAVTKAAIDQLETEIEAVEADAFISGWYACMKSDVRNDDGTVWGGDEHEALLDAALDKYMKGQGEL